MPSVLTKLEKLLIDEVSAVDFPANESDGWLVLKAAEASDGETAATPAAPTLKDRLGLLFGKEEVEVTPEELKAILDEREDALVEKVAAKLSAATVDAPAEGAGAAVTVEKTAEQIAADAAAAAAPAPVTAPAALTEEDVTKAIKAAIEAAQEPLIEAVSKTIDRVAAVEARFVTRKSVENDAADEDVTKNTNTVSAAIAGAFAGRS